MSIWAANGRQSYISGQTRAATGWRGDQLREYLRLIPGMNIWKGNVMGDFWGSMHHVFDIGTVIA